MGKMGDSFRILVEKPQEKGGHVQIILQWMKKKIMCGLDSGVSGQGLSSCKIANEFLY